MFIKRVKKISIVLLGIMLLVSSGLTTVKAEEEPDKKEATLTVSFVDERTVESIKDGFVLDGEVGNTWPSIDVEDSILHEELGLYGLSHSVYKGLEESSGKGTFESGVRGKRTLTYIYAQLGTVTFNYVDTENTEIADSVTRIGERDDAWTSDLKEIVGYKFKEVKDDKATSGEYTKDPQEVTYVYDKEATLTVSFVDERTEESIKDGFVLDGEVGNTWPSIDVEDSILHEELGLYGLSHSVYKGLDENTGKGTFERGALGERTLTYIYAQLGVVTFNYVDTDNIPIPLVSPISKTGERNEPWTPEQKEIDGYKFKKVIDNTDGNYAKDPQEVTYVYYKEIPWTPIEPIVKGDVVVKYEDTKGTALHPDFNLNGQLGKAWTSEQLDFEGYKFKEVIGDTPGVFTEEAQTVTYVYYKSVPWTPIEPILKGKVVVRYEDTKGVALEKETRFNGQVGKTWTTEQKEFDGYKFKEVKGATSGTFTEAEQRTTYVYYKSIPWTPIEPIVKGDVAVKYEDTKGTALHPDFNLNGQLGKAWTSEQLDFEGYKFKEVIGDTPGVFTEEAQTVTYVYDILITPGEPGKPEEPGKPIVKAPDKGVLGVQKLPSTGIQTLNTVHILSIASILLGSLLLLRKRYSFDSKDE